MRKNLEEALHMTIEEWLYYHQNEIHFYQKYKGLRMLKNPFDLVMYEEILWANKPNVVIEIGNAYGGFTFWLADRLKSLDIPNRKIITIDLEEVGRNNLREVMAPEIVAVIGDCNDRVVVEKVRDFIAKDDRVMIIEDSAHTYDNTIRALENYRDFVTPGQYFVVEDGICDLLDLGIKPGPKAAVEDWIGNNPDYIIDRDCEKYIMTYNPKGYLKRMK